MKSFTVDSLCVPEENYMVDIREKASRIIRLVDNKKYFTINCARQYGKTTMLFHLKCTLRDRYYVLSTSFAATGNEEFSSGAAFVRYFVRSLVPRMEHAGCPAPLIDSWRDMSDLAEDKESFSWLRSKINVLCSSSDRPIVLMIDEVDRATNNEVFLYFLSTLRDNYLSARQKMEASFQSVILAGVTDITNLKMKIRPEEEHQLNSPWNIAARFPVDMSFSAPEIFSMLQEYEADYHTGMDIPAMATQIREWTGGYPFLVSRICQCLEEELWGTPHFETRSLAWTRDGLLAAVRLILNEDNTLFSGIIKQITDHPDLDTLIQDMLFHGETYAFNPDDPRFQMGRMYGILSRRGEQICVSNRIFEIRLYNWYFTREKLADRLHGSAQDLKNRFTSGNHLHMDLVLKKFQEHFTAVYGSNTDSFVENNGRKIFLLFIRTIINGTGNYYVEAETQDRQRTDVIVDYLGEQFIVELKIWHGPEYHRRGEDQLIGYLERYHLTRGYMVSFNFNQNKVPGVHEVLLGDKSILEAVV